MKKRIFRVQGEYITLQNLLKAEGLVSTGGEAKYMILDGFVSVNGECESRRGRKLRSGDVIVFEKVEITVA